MKKMSRRMKRMIALLVVEVLIAINVLTAYADEAGQPMTFTDAEVVEMTKSEPVVEQQPVQEEPAQEESTQEETIPEEPTQEEPAAEPVIEEPAAEPVIEEIPAEVPTEAPVVEENIEDGAVEAPTATTEVTEGTEEATPTPTAEATPSATPEDAMATATPTAEPTATPSATPSEIVEEDNSVTVTAICVAEGVEIAESFTISVSDVIDVAAQAPEVTGYTFTGKATLADGTEITQLKKEVTEAEDTVTTVMSYMANGTWVELTEDITITFEYTAVEDAEAAATVHFYAVCEDAEGNVIVGYEKAELSVSDTLDLTAAPYAIEGYEYLNAKIDGQTVISLEKKIDIDENETEVVSYSYTTEAGTTVVTEDVTVTLVYEAIAAEPIVTLTFVDEEGMLLAELVEAEFEAELVLDNPEAAPAEIEGYIYKEALLDEVVITALTKTVDEATGETVVSYVTAEETVAIEEDTTIALVYEEEAVVVNVNATCVDEFGDAIGDKYTEMELPAFTDNMLVLDDVENPPVKDITRWKSLFKIVKYTYVKASIGSEIITGLKREVTADTAELKDGEKEYIYSYTTDGTNWIKIQEDTTIVLGFSGGSKTTYTYEDDQVMVVATLQHADALPDEAEFVVTPVTPSTSGYNYDAYMEALNESTEKISENIEEFTEENTLLYDVAFLAPAVDENGDVMEGEMVEYQPAEGMVNISFTFKKSQISEGLEAVQAKEVSVVHLPLVDSVKEQNATTAQATDITAEDIKIEVVESVISLEGSEDKADFNLSDFSVMAVAADGAASENPTSNEKMADENYTLEYLLRSYNIVALENLQIEQHTVGSIMVMGNLEGTANNNFGQDAKAPSYIGGKKESPFYMSNMCTQPLYIGSGNTITYPYEYMDHTNVNGILTSYKRTVYENPNYVDATKLKTAITGTMSGMQQQSTAVYNVSGTEEGSPFQIPAGSNVTLQLNGEYQYLKLEGIDIDKAEPTVINILDSGTVNIPRVIGLSTGDSGNNMSIVFNIPNASKVLLQGDGSSLFGHVVAPNADIDATCGNYSGCLVGKNIYATAEGHMFPYTEGNGSLVKPTSNELVASKTVNGNVPTAEQVFSFGLTKLENGVWKDIKTVTNNGENINFGKIDYAQASDLGTHWYRVYEVQTDMEGYVLTTVQYLVKVEVTSSMSGNDEIYSANTTYYKVNGSESENIDASSLITNGSVDESKLTQVSGKDDVVFDNKKIEKGSITVTKAVTGTDNAAFTGKTFYFVLKDSTGAVVGGVREIKNGTPVTISDLTLGNYTIEETDANGNAVAYNGATFPFEVTYAGNDITLDANNKDVAATITNTYNPEKTQISGSKTWEDNNDQDGIRPESITINLLADNVKKTSQTVKPDAEGKWTYSFTNLDKYTADGKEIVYTITEDPVDGYTTGIVGYNVTNTHTPADTQISGTKVWNDNNNQDGLRPASITVNLLANGSKVNSVTVTEADGWAWSFTDLPKFEDGKEITYTVSEDVVEGYSVAITGTAAEGFVITNTHKPGETGASVTKVWVDNNDQDGIRPDSITVKLLANGEVVDTQELNAGNNWTYNWSGLAAKKAGKEIVYTIEEVSVDGYTATTAGEVKTGYTITNTHETEKTEVKGSKTWNDGNNQDGLRPDSITIKLYADGVATDKSVVVSSADGWAYSFTGLDKYKDGGTAIVYTIVEEAVEGYETSYNGYNVINTHVPETIEISGSKTWDDNDNQDGVRPSSIVVNLLANNEVKKSVEVTPDADGNWSWSFTELPKFEKGKEITYTVSENEVKDYSTTINGYDITNKHTPDETAISVVKVWDDANNQDGIRPASIQVQLKANGKNEGEVVTLNEGNSWSYTWNNLPKKSGGLDIAYTVEEVSVPEDYTVDYTTSGTTTTITNKHEVEKTSVSGIKVWEDADNQDGIRPDSVTVRLFANGEDTTKVVTATKDGNWSWSFTDLDKFAGGKEIVYTVKEDAVTGYTTAITGSATEGITITNTHTPEKTQISGKKVWEDNNNQDGVRPAEITVTLYANGESTGKTATAKAEDWTFEFTDLDKFAKGVEIKYTVVETKVEGYTTQITGSATSGYTITNTHEPGKTNYTVQKFWEDADNQDGMRPTSIQVQLLADGDAYGEAVTLNEGNGWKYTWSDLDEKANGTKIAYSVEEITISDEYTVSYTDTENGKNITNTHKPEKTEITGTKTWVDNEDQDGKRPESITITLYANGVVKETKTVTADDNWTWTFKDLDVYENGTKIEYEIAEDVVEGYTTEISGFNVTNTHEIEKTEISGIKVWDDANNQDGKRPSEITVNLLANGTKVDSKTVTADAEGKWSYEFKDLDKYADGKVIEYTVREEVASLESLGYSVSYDGTTITNKYTPGKTNLKVVKVWDDADNQDGKRPASIDVQLMADGKAVDGSTVTLSEANNWTAEWTELDLMKAGVKIEYSAQEVGTVTGYEIGEPATADGVTTITNTHKPEEVTLEGTKTWNDADNQDGLRPTEITVVLVKNGTVTETTAKATAANGWKYSFNNLPKYENGKEIEYSIQEISVEGYTTEINGFDIANTHEPEKTELSGKKVWDDANNQDGKRPESVTINLLADGKETGKSVVATEETGWEWSFTGLDKFADGEEIVYTVTENAVDEYTTTIEGTTITNTYKPGVTDHSVVKVWNDNKNQDGKRPTSIEVQLYADGTALGDAVTLNEANNWIYKWEDLDLMSAGKEITYTVKEVTEVDEYKTEAVTDAKTRITTITNSYDVKKTEVEGTKTWNDADNQDGKRPESITINLLADGKEVAEKVVTASDNWTWKFENLDVYKDGKVIEYTITEDAVENYTSVVDGFNVTNTHEPEKTKVEGTKTWNDADNQDGVRPESIQINLLANGETKQSVTVTEADGWKWSFTNLDKYADGEEITYTITETITNGYTAEVNGFDVTNSYTPGKTSLTVTKVWDDKSNQDGIRPDTVQVQLYADGKAVEGKTAELNAANNWTYTWKDLDEKKNGQTIVYTAQETEVADYKVSYNNEKAGSTVITNTHTPELTKVSGAKTWKDNNDQDGKRPTSITINLLADGEKVASQSVSADADGNWSYEFKDLPKFRDQGTEIAYTITEEEVAEYTTSIDGFNVTNTHTPEKVDVEGSKTWNDNDNAEMARPESITIRLYADGEEIDSVTVTEADGWKWSFADLDKYAEGEEITYSIKEDAVFDYTTDTNGYDVTNTYTPGVTSISVTKVWDDNDNQDGLRAESVMVQLYEKFGIFNLKRGEAIELSADNNWTYTWEDLPVEKQKEKVQYLVKEIDKITGYETVINNGDGKSTNITITNVNEPETVKVEGTKTWVDADNQDGVRPTSININLLADGKQIDSVKVEADEKGNWSYSFENLPKYRDGGVEIVYTITEDAVTDYEAAIDGYNVTNTHTPEDTEYSVKKVWEDKNNQDGIRPESITVQLLANGEAIGEVVTLSDENGWSATWTELDKYADGKVIVYTAKEVEVPDGYTMAEEHDKDAAKTTITNTHTPEKTSVEGTKTWSDADNQDGVRPASITIRLYADDVEIAFKEVTASDNWTWKFDNLDKYAAGEEITYTITEDKVDNYTSAVDGFNVTNTHEPEKTKVEGTKTWNDADNQDGVRPESIQINLLANGETKQSVTVTEADGWKWSFTNLDKYADGEEITYTITETITNGYTAEVDGFDVTNSYTPGKTSLTVTKVWDDKSNQDGIRPTSVQVQLYADGKAVEGKTATLDADNSWTYTWTDLDEKKDGQTITYTAQETEVAGYEVSYNNEKAGSTVITNTHTPELTKVSGAKTWDDNNDQDGKRPESITINLLADGEKVASQTVSADADGNWSYEFKDLPKFRDQGTEIVYTITEEEVAEYTTSIDGFNVTNTHAPEKVDVEGSKTWNDNDNAENARPESITIRLYADGEEIDSVTVTEADGWKWSFADLDKYAEGEEITYSITEDAVFDYTTEINGYDVTNTYTPGVTSISVTKVWDDNDNQDGLRAESVMVQLYEKFGIFNLKRGEAIELSADNNWTYTWENLPVEKQKEKVQYLVKEIDKITGYETEINNGDGKSTNITITNVNEPETIKIEGIKTWVDAENQDGVRPASVTIRLIADAGTAFEEEVAVATANAESNWSYSFENLPKYRDGGVEIVYTITEDAVTDYDTSIDGYNVTNMHVPADTEYSVKKVWEDKNNQDGIRPESITVQLLANGEPVSGKNAILSDENGWSATWTELDKYEDGEVIVYTAKEVEVPDGYTMTVDHDQDAAKTTITNTHTTDTTSVSGAKAWKDADNQDGVRPASITIRLYANDVEVDSKTVTAADDWKWSFTDLDKYAAGKEITYTIKEDTVAGYTTTITGFDVENSYTPETVKVEGTKTWNDADNQDGKRPESIEINLYADGMLKETKTVTEADGWAWSFTELPKYKDQGTEIVYTITETAVAEYTTVVNGYDVTNSYTPGETSVTVIKAWDDANDQDGVRPEAIQVQLFADGEAHGAAVTLNEGNSWTYTWTELDEMKAGQKIVYTVDEVGEAEGYTKVVSGDATTGFTITNTHTPELTEIAGAKTWLDENNQDGLRPESITINLLADGEQIDSVKVTEENSWTWSFTNLPKYKDGGKEIVYTFTEEAVEGYTTEVKGASVINTHVPELTEVEGSKTWNDDENAEEVRPESITIRLYADGEEIDSVTVTEAEGWKWSFTELPKYKDGGKEIVYTITEDKVTDYSTTVEGYDVTNEYTPEETQISVTKIWDDAEDQDGLRPDSIQVQLYEEVLGFIALRVRGEVVTLDAENNWTYTWEKLPAKKFGVEVTYTVKEVTEVEGYETTIVDGTSTTITNTHIPEVVDIEGIKVWDDAENQDGIRPESITVKLLADGVDTGKSVTVTAEDNWAWSFSELPKNKNVNGEVSEILYTIEEFTVEGYETAITGSVEDGFTVTNTHTPEVIEIEGTKTWDDADNQDGIRPESITIRLFADGEEIKSVTVSEADGWTYKFTDLPKFKAGVEIVYTITEDIVESYSTTYDGYNVTNSYTPSITARTVVKVWKDQGNKDKIRPGSIVVQLLADGEAYGDAVTLSSANGWTYTWSELPEKKAGQTIVYSVAEISSINGYSVKYSDDGFTITNTHTPKEPEPTPTPTPDEPEPTPYVPNPTPTPVEPEPIVPVRVEEGGDVLGARRGTDRAVLGKRRRPATGDSMALILWVMALAGSVGTALTSVVMLGHDKKRK